MFEHLVESGSHSEDLKRKGSFLAGFAQRDSAGVRLCRNLTPPILRAEPHQCRGVGWRHYVRHSFPGAYFIVCIRDQGVVGSVGARGHCYLVLPVAFKH